MNPGEKRFPAVCYGESLWDILPDNTVPGGAPMNVAYHLRKLGILPALISRVGLDNYGKRLIQLLEKQDMVTDFFQMDFELDTGKVRITPGEGDEIHYDIVRPVAWDNMQWDDQFVPLLAQATYFIYGSLGARSEASRRVLYRLLDIASFPVLDINLRPPHYDKAVLEHLLRGVQLLKLNVAELELLTGWFADYATDEERMCVLQDRFHIPTVVVTRGSRGSLMTMEGEFYDHPGFSVELADTVGSGDAFLAGLLYMISKGASPPASIEFASAIGALIATYNGPCPDYHIEEITKLIAH